MHHSLPLHLRSMSEDAAASPLATLLQANPELLETSDYHCDDDDLEELEGTLGFELPSDLATLLRLSDGGTLRGPTRSLHLASAEELADWARRGLMQAFDALPFAVDESGVMLVTDVENQWGGGKGVIYRVRTGRRAIHGQPLQDAIRVAKTLSELFEYLANGQDAW